MKLFSCGGCGQIVFFENVTCLRCGRALVYLPDRGVMATAGAQRGASDAERSWTPGAADAGFTRRYRFCPNDLQHSVCNWAVPDDDPESFCASCRLNQTIPNLAAPGAYQAWHRMEMAKRRLLPTLWALGLATPSKAERPDQGLAFAFLTDDGQHKVFTGHSDGLVTINLAEADDPFREKMRVQMGETYRTLLGHFRHEIGHYYWDRLMNNPAHLLAFRARFGDETANYEAAAEQHYRQGARADWPMHFVSAYASVHPWEDWAETWAHVLHMTDTLETARALGMTLNPRPVAGGAAPTVVVHGLDGAAFDQLTDDWLQVTMALNILNRSMGLPDPYPFALSAPALEKLRFVYNAIRQSSLEQKPHGA